MHNKDKADTDQPYLETEIAEWLVISRLENGHNITAQIIDAGIKGTRVLVAVSPLPKFINKNKKQQVIYSIPQLGLTNVMSIVQSEDDGNSSETYWLDSGDNVDMTLIKYKEYYEKKGYKVRSNRVVPDGKVEAMAGFLMARNKKENIRMDLVSVSEKTRIIAVRNGY